MDRMNVIEVLIKDIDADDDFNCRGQIAPIDVNTLAQNIKEIGIQQPGIIMPHPDPSKGFKYKLVAGFRRRMALIILKHTRYPCVLKDNMTDDDAMFFNLNENIQREQLTIMQEALSIGKIRVNNPLMNRDAIAVKLGKGSGWVQIRVMLLELPPEVQQEVNAGLISQLQVRELHTIRLKEGTEKCYEVAKEMKSAKKAGRKPRIKKKVNRNSKRERKRVEIFNMLADINESIPFKNPDGSPSLWSRTLAWASGEISDKELFESCQDFCKHYDIIWSDPDAAYVVGDEL